jgi:hypothetical protein
MPFGHGAYLGTTKKPTRRGISIIPLFNLRVKAFFAFFLYIFKVFSKNRVIMLYYQKQMGASAPI